MELRTSSACLKGVARESRKRDKRTLESWLLTLQADSVQRTPHALARTPSTTTAITTTTATADEGMFLFPLVKQWTYTVPLLGSEK